MKEKTIKRAQIITYTEKIRERILQFIIKANTKKLMDIYIILFRQDMDLDKLMELMEYDPFGRKNSNVSKELEKTTNG